MKKLSIVCCVFSALAGILHVEPLIFLLDMFDYIHIYGMAYLLQRYSQEGWSLFSLLMLLYFLFLALSILFVLTCKMQRGHRLRLFFIFYLGSSVVSFLVSEVLFEELSPLGILYSFFKLLIILAVLFVHKNTDETFF